MTPNRSSKKPNDSSDKGVVSPHHSNSLLERGTHVFTSKSKKGTASRNATGIRKKPRQQRSKQMVLDILEAASEVFAQMGYARATTNHIAERAGVSVGSLYQYFPNKDCLLASLFEQHHVAVHKITDQSLAELSDPTTPLEDVLRRLISALVALHRATPSLTKALSVEVLRQSPVADMLHDETKDRHQILEIGAILAARPDVRNGDHMAMAAVLNQSTSQLIRWLVHDFPPGVEPRSLLEEVIQLLTRYLSR